MNEFIAGMDENTEAAAQQCEDLIQLTENAMPAMSRLLLTSVYTNNIQSRIRFVMRRWVRFRPRLIVQLLFGCQLLILGYQGATST